MPAQVFRRTPHGVRGLKYNAQLGHDLAHGRTPHGVRGLKYSAAGKLLVTLCRRTPHGVRGLKYVRQQFRRDAGPVAPRTGCVD